MRLTEPMKSQFFDAVMTAHPTIDYAGRARTIATGALIAECPPEVRALFGTGAEPYLCFGWYRLPGDLGHLRAIRPRAVTTHLGYLPVWGELEKLAALDSEQAMKTGRLQSKLYDRLNRCSTVEQLADELPEFAQYLPNRNI